MDPAPVPARLTTSSGPARRVRDPARPHLHEAAPDGLLRHADAALLVAVDEVRERAAVGVLHDDADALAAGRGGREETGAVADDVGALHGGEEADLRGTRVCGGRSRRRLDSTTAPLPFLNCCYNISARKLILV
jgi:hypothetical protein